MHAVVSSTTEKAFKWGISCLYCWPFSHSIYSSNHSSQLNILLCILSSILSSTFTKWARTLEVTSGSSINLWIRSDFWILSGSSIYQFLEHSFLDHLSSIILFWFELERLCDVSAAGLDFDSTSIQNWHLKFSLISWTATEIENVLEPFL